MNNINISFFSSYFALMNFFSYIFLMFAKKYSTGSEDINIYLLRNSISEKKLSCMAGQKSKCFMSV